MNSSSAFLQQFGIVQLYLYIAACIGDLCVGLDCEQFCEDNATATCGCRSGYNADGNRCFGTVPRFYPCDAMLWPCVCLCLSGCYKSVFCRNGWTDRAGFWFVGFFRPILHCVSDSGIYKNNGTSLWNFVQNSGLKKICFGVSIVETCYRLSWRKVDAQSVINWTVVNQLG